MDLNKHVDDARFILKSFDSKEQVDKFREELLECLDASFEYSEYGEREHFIEELADVMLTGMQMMLLLGAYRQVWYKKETAGNSWG